MLTTNRAINRKFKNKNEKMHYTAYSYRLFSLTLPEIAPILRILIDLSQRL